MYRFLIPLILLSPLRSSGQRVIETFYDYKWLQTSAEDASFFGTMKRTDSGWYRQVEYIHSNSWYSEGLYVDADATIPNGYNYIYYPNGKLKASGKFMQGKRVGLWLTHYESGKLEDSLYYINGGKTANQR